MLKNLTNKPSQQTQDLDSMLAQRWSNVVDGEPTLNQHWFNVLVRWGRTHSIREEMCSIPAQAYTHWAHDIDLTS